MTRPPGTPLKVRTRTTITGSGATDSEATVECPRREETVCVEECHACTLFLRTLVEGGKSVIECTDPSAPHTAGLAQPRPARLPSEADSTPVTAIMTGDVVCVTPDVSLQALGSLLCERGISGAPVVDDEGFPIGVVSKTDLVRDEYSGVGSNGSGLVEDAMVPMAFTLRETATISQVAALMAFEGVHRVPVVSAAGKVVGIVSTLDVIRWLARHDGYLSTAH